MTTHQLSVSRRQNLIRLIDSRFEGNASKLGLICDRSLAQISSLTRHKEPKPIGEKLARALEVELDLPVGWLDGEIQAGNDDALSSEDDAFLLQIRNLLRTKATPKHMMETIITVLNSAPDKKCYLPCLHETV